jgi:hypothetical protein
MSHEDFHGIAEDERRREPRARRDIGEYEFTPAELRERIKDQLFPSLIKSEEEKRAFLEHAWQERNEEQAEFEQQLAIEYAREQERQPKHD